jgi:hypothetical protein
LRFLIGVKSADAMARYPQMALTLVTSERANRGDASPVEVEVGFGHSDRY